MSSNINVVFTAYFQKGAHSRDIPPDKSQAWIVILEIQNPLNPVFDCTFMTAVLPVKIPNAFVWDRARALSNAFIQDLTGALGKTEFPCHFERIY